MHDYVGSKMDWIGAGLPFEGTLAERPMLGTLADRHAPTCAMHDLSGTVGDQLRGWPVAVVIGPGRIVRGLVRAEALGHGARERPIVEIMEEGPSTYRPHVTAAELAPKLEKRPVPFVIVTTLDGRLVGVADPAEIRAAAEKDPG